jgi:ABC-2 type transport system ATP-binding protein
MIRIENLWKKFGRFDALRGLSFDVPDGSAFAMIGANGAGKTTTIKVLMNILVPTRGNATFGAGACADRVRLGKPRHAIAPDGRGIYNLSAALLSHVGP